MEPHSIIDEFVRDYIRGQDFYTKAAELCRELCRDLLVQNGIRHIATSRSKRRDRLREKLYQRSEEKPDRYKTKQDILDDLIDLAGVRIALYFPGERRRASELLREALDVEDERSFPKVGQPRRGDGIHDYRFRGYSATHLLVRLKSVRDQDIDRYRDARIEIQIASVFMHAWSEVEHDLVYKPFSGELSQNEYALLDQVNGLAYTGEVALEHLQRATTSRVNEGSRLFTNQYELAAFICDGVSTTVADPKMGRADTLLRYLRELQMDGPPKIEPFLKQLSVSDARPLVDQLVDLITAADPDSSESRRNGWARLCAEARGPDLFETDRGPRPESHNLERRFRKHWKTLSAVLHRIATASTPSGQTAPRRTDLSMIRQLVRLEQASLAKLTEADQIYTRLLTDAWSGPDAELAELSDLLERVIASLYEQFPYPAAVEARSE